jgi:hypothetical protein
VQPPIFAKSEVEAQFPGDVMRLIFVTLHALNAEHFLQSDHVRVDLAQNFDYPVGTKLAIQTNAFMNVISNDAKLID